MNVGIIVINFQAPSLTGKRGPRICKSHFNTTDIIVKDNTSRLLKEALPKSDITLSDTDNNLVFYSSDGVKFPTNAANIAKNSPFIRRILQDWREESQVILVDLDHKVLSIVLSLFYAISIPFSKSLIEKVKNALEIFEIDESLVTIAKAHKTGEEEYTNVSTAEEGNDEEKQPSVSRTRKEIECPFENCSSSSKQRHIFLKHLCDHHFKDEIEELMKGRKSDTGCLHQDCQFSTQSSDNRNLRHHIAIKHKYTNTFLLKSFDQGIKISLNNISFQTFWETRVII